MSAGGGAGYSGTDDPSALLGERAAALAELARTTGARPMTPLQRMVGLHAVTARLASRRLRRLGAIGAVTFGLAATAAAALLLTGRLDHGGRSPSGPAIASTTARRPDGAGVRLGYRIDGGEVGAGGYVRAVGAAGTVLRFSEGTELRLPAGARGRLSAVDEHGARFAIEEGEAAVHVVPRPGARWMVDAGPFLITVHGTVFTARWDGGRERLDVRLENGLVSVTGPLTEGTISVRAGQRLTVKVKEKEVVLREDRPGGDAEGPAGESASGGPAPRAAAHPQARTHRGSRPGNARAAAARAAVAIVEKPAPPARSWAAALAAGDVDAIITEAERRGVDVALADASSDDLAALADAARYRRRNALARRALLAERDRFPRTSRARDAAFLLGRMEEGTAGGGAGAVRWYERYLDEAPAGAYASEALGRKMTAVEKLEGTRAAQAVAEDYLRRFPGGTYAGAARALRDLP